MFDDSIEGKRYAAARNDSGSDSHSLVFLIANSMPINSQTPAEPAVAQRCVKCFRPARLCFCDSIPLVHNRTGILILQHRRERFHPFNTARIVRHGLQNCQLIADHNRALADQFESVSLSTNVGLLYPSESSRVLADLQPDELPDQLVVIDGTWHHAKSLMRDIPKLRTLPHYRLAPTSPGRYRIRREPNEYALSTIEATVSALKSLEPETEGLDRLLKVFDDMIDTQISQSDNDSWRHDRRRRSNSSNIPRSLCGDLSNIVVAYGEQEEGKDSRFKNSDNRSLIYWVAQRLGTGEQFRCAIESPQNLGDKFLSHMRLTQEDFQSARSISEFRQQWKTFLRPGDQLAVYHASTARALRDAGAEFVPVVILKSIHGNSNVVSGTLDEFLASKGFESLQECNSRASERLSNAVAYIWMLNSEHRSD